MGVSHEFRNVAYSLWVLFAFSVLEHALLQLRDEGVFASRKSNLEALMLGSRAALPWQDYAIVDKARNRRNDVAHRRAMLERAESWKYVSAIERELKAWRIII